MPRIGLPPTWTKKENIRIVGFAPQENELLVWLISTSGAAERGPSAEHPCNRAACRSAIRSLPISAVDGDRPGGSERHASDPTRRPAGQAAKLSAIPANEQRDDEVPEASAVNDAAVAAYGLSVQAGNPLSERRLAHMFGHGAFLRGNDLMLLMQRLESGAPRVHLDAEVARLERLAAKRAEGANLVGDAGPGRPAVLRAADESRFAQ